MKLLFLNLYIIELCLEVEDETRDRYGKMFSADTLKV